MKNIRSLFICITCVITLSAFSDNPVIKNIGMSDPHVRVYNDTAYLYCGHDHCPDDKTWVMKEWRVFKSADLVNWQQISTISTADNYMPDNSTDCWAGDAAERDGKYYFYFSDGKRGIGVMKANVPGGHYIDELGKPLVSPMHDPTILIDDDENKTPYMVYGDKVGEYHVVRLNNDMISLAEKPKALKINGKEWNAAPQWMDKNYIFKRGNKYYLSWGRDYAISDDIYGPYHSVGAVGVGHHLNEYAHGSFFWKGGQFYHMWCHYIRPGYKYRETIISYCHFDDEGRIVTDTKFLDKHFENGVGKYSASWDKIEAEWFTSKSDNLTKKGNKQDGFKMECTAKVSWLHFANVDFSEGKFRHARLKLHNIGANIKIEIRLKSQTGPVIGELIVNDSNIGESHSLQLEQLKGEEDIFIVFNSDKESKWTLDWIKFLQ